MSKIGVAKSATTVRYGPNATLYASVGSIDANESVVVHGKENGWYCISYSAGNTLKRGFVPTGTFTNESELSAEPIITSGYSKTAKTALTVYTGPIPSNYAIAGYISAGEIVTAFLPTYEDYTYVEYGTGSGVKRGYVRTSELTTAKGKLAIMYAKATVYFGPSTEYVVSGSIAADEYCVIVSCETPFGSSAKWCQIEYISGSSRKCGYIKQGGIVPFGSLSTLSGIRTVYGNAMMLSDQTVYTGPSSSYVAAGSVSLNEMVQTLGKSQESSSYTYIEYSTSSGKKRGYVAASSISEEILFPDTMAQAAAVYGGPSSVIYASIGSVSSGEAVAVIAKENGWFAIDYIALTQIKRGYVPISTLENGSTISASFSERNFTGHMDQTTKALSVYSGPADSYATVGSLASDEAVSVITGASNSYAHVEYSTPTGTRRGYIPLTALSNKSRGILGQVNNNATVYYGASSSFLKIGGIYADEYVIVLDRETSNKYNTLWYYIEFNAASGRKRGFVDQTAITLCSTGSSLSSLKTGDHLASANADLTVYSGPSNTYATVGSISALERVSVYAGRSYESDYAFIEYCTPSGVKMGYVSASELLTTSFGIPVPNTTVMPTVYGTSGTGKHSLRYYRIGTGPHVLAAVFAVHGYEDAWAADGLELCKLANRLIETLAAETADWKSTWSVYIFPVANPDGITEGYTHNGPGRTTVSKGIDINRCFPSNFVATYTARNYTGATSLLAPEAQALYTTLKNIQNSATTMRLLDIHGWLNTTYGDSTLSTPFCAQFGFGNQSVMGGKGYLSRWAISMGMSAALIELPFPYSISDISDKQYFEKLNAAMHTVLAQEVAIYDDTVLYAPGYTGEEVGVLEAFLKYNGYYTGDVDEYYGNLVCAAIKTYQSDNALTASGNVNSATLFAMGFATNSTGKIRDNLNLYNKYFDRAKFYISYQETRDRSEKCSIKNGENYIRCLAVGKQLAFSTSGGTPVVAVESLVGGNMQIYTLKETHNGYKISPKGFDGYVLTVNPVTHTVFLALDTDTCQQRWCIETDESGDTCWFSVVDCIGMYLCTNGNSTSLYLSETKQRWSCRKVIQSRKITDTLRTMGVTISYALNTGYETKLDQVKEEDAENRAAKVADYGAYANYYLDYTQPIMKFFDSTYATCSLYAVPPLDAYSNPEAETQASLGVLWLALVANSFYQFYTRVNHWAEWDIKREKVWNNAFSDTLPFIPTSPNEENGNKFIFRGNFRTSEDMGNILYGYTGALFGFGDELLYWAGGAAAQSEGSGLTGFIEAATDSELLNDEYFLDDPWDHYAIKEGYDLAYELFPSMTPGIPSATVEAVEAIINHLREVGFLE